MHTIRFAARSDVRLLKTMIDEFAEFEHFSVSITGELWLGMDSGQSRGFAFSWQNQTVSRIQPPASGRQQRATCDEFMDAHAAFAC